MKAIKTAIQKRIISYLWNSKPWLVRKYERFLDWTK